MFGGKKVRTRKGKEVTLLNPAQKGAKFAHELKFGCKVTNDGNAKVGKDNDIVTLDKTERAYRSGYLDARKDSANCYNYKKGKR